MSLRYDEAEVPHQMKDEDKWIGLTKKQWAIIAPVLIVFFLILRITINSGVWWLGAIISIPGMISTIILVVVRVPESMYLYGAGKPMYVPVFFFLRKKLSKKNMIYSKNIKLQKK